MSVLHQLPTVTISKTLAGSATIFALKAWGIGAKRHGQTTLSREFARHQ